MLKVKVLCEFSFCNPACLKTLNSAFFVEIAIMQPSHPALLIVHDSTALGGAEQILLEILKAARSWGMKTYLITRKEEALFADFCALTDDHLVLPFPYPRKPKSWVHLLSFYFKTRAWVKQLPHPVVVLSGDFYSLWAALLLKAPNRRVYSLWQGALNAHSGRKWAWYGANRADGLMAASPVIESMQKSRAIHKPFIDFNPTLDIQRFDPACYDSAAIREALGFRSQDLLALCTGRIGEGKEQLWLAEAFLKDERLKHWKLLLAGPINEGHEHFKTLKAHDTDNRLHLLGARKDIPELLAIADLTIFPGEFRESFGLSVAEAALMNCPVLATAVGAIPYLLQEHPGLVKVENRALLFDLWAHNPLESFKPSSAVRAHIKQLVDRTQWAAILKVILGLTV